MKVILTRDVPQVGKDGEVVLVADGFARNYLFPRQLATVAKGALLKQHQNRLTREIARGAALLTSAQANGETLKDKQFLIVAKANVKSTRLFGAVTEADVAAVILKETGVDFTFALATIKNCLSFKVSPLACALVSRAAPLAISRVSLF